MAMLTLGMLKTELAFHAKESMRIEGEREIQTYIGRLVESIIKQIKGEKKIIYLQKGTGKTQKTKRLLQNQNTLAGRKTKTCTTQYLKRTQKE